jgi:L-alanine-DL-glutamate epimerase-like enolase superfamily enzyme
VRIVEIRESSVPISRHAGVLAAPATLTTSVVAVITDTVTREGPVIGYGFSSFGRFAQSGLIRERFAPRLLQVSPSNLLNSEGNNFDPFRAWEAMMQGEKPGGHGERCVAVGTLDMAIWDAAAKIASTPLHQFLTGLVGTVPTKGGVPAYAAGGYAYPSDDIRHLCDEVRRFLDHGYTHIKIKIGATDLSHDLQRVEAVLKLLHAPDCLAVDAMHAYDRAMAKEVANKLRGYGLWWIEDFLEPLDLEGLAQLAADYCGTIAAGESLFSESEARLLDLYGGLDRHRDYLLFDPVHCYGIPGYLRIVVRLLDRGWPRSAFWPHGGHLFSIQIAKALGLGGVEVNPRSFQPFGGLADNAKLHEGRICVSADYDGIGFEHKSDLCTLLRNEHLLSENSRVAIEASGQKIT